MNRVQAIWDHPLYRQEYDRLQRMETGRKFCRHSIVHFLDVARVCRIMALEQELPVTKEEAYALGLLHDIGKGRQYEFGTPHHQEGARLARVILADCNFSPEEISAITEAILLHRQPTEHDNPLVRLLYDADKQTRLCFCCSAAEECSWPEEKKNHHFV